GDHDAPRGVDDLRAGRLDAGADARDDPVLDEDVAHPELRRHVEDVPAADERPARARARSARARSARAPRAVRRAHVRPPKSSRAASARWKTALSSACDQRPARGYGDVSGSTAWTTMAGPVASYIRRRAAATAASSASGGGDSTRSQPQARAAAPRSRRPASGWPPPVS